MTPEEVLLSLYRLRVDVERRAIQRYQMGIGLPYTDELREIDGQIEEISKRVPAQSLFTTVNDFTAVVKIEQLKEKIGEKTGQDSQDLSAVEKKTNALEEIYNLEFELKSLEYDEKRAIEECTKGMVGRGITTEGAKVHYNPIWKEYELKKLAVSEKLDKAKFQYNILCLKLKPSEKSRTRLTSEEYKVSVRDREIWVNEYLIGKPHAIGSNFEFFEHIRLQRPNIKVNRETLSNFGGSLSLKEQVKSKSFIKIVNELGFKGEILKAFFYNRSKDTLTYKGDQITKEDLEKAGVKISLFLKELEMAHTKNSPE